MGETRPQMGHERGLPLNGDKARLRTEALEDGPGHRAGSRPQLQDYRTRRDMGQVMLQCAVFCAPVPLSIAYVVWIFPGSFRLRNPSFERSVPMFSVTVQLGPLPFGRCRISIGSGTKTAGCSPAVQSNLPPYEDEIRSGGYAVVGLMSGPEIARS